MTGLAFSDGTRPSAFSVHKPKSLYRTAATLALFLLLTVSAAFGQATDGNISGSILDSSGGAIAKADVTVENNATGVKTAVTSNASGLYRAGNLIVGTYKVTASAPGFSPATIEGVAVALNVNSTVNVTLAVGSVNSAVQVTEATAIIDTTTAQVTNTYNSQFATELPSTVNPAGGILNLALLGAGVTSSGGVGVGTGPSVGGQRPRNNSFNIEGVDNNRKDVTGPVASVPPETVAEFTIIQNQFSAEFGHSTGGQFNTVLRSGTNQIHGAAWEYLQNRNLNAINQSFARLYVGSTLPQAPRYDQNRLGGMIGGPIKKNKLFYFGAYDYTPLGQASVAASASYSPTAAGYSLLAGIPQLNQTNLGILRKYVDPAPVQAPGKAGTTTVAGVTIPIGILPIVAPNFTNVTRWLVAVDYNLSARDQLRARYVDNKTASIDTSATLPVFFTSRPTTAHIATFSEFHNFSPSVVNEFRFAYNRYNDNIVVPNFAYPGLDVFPNVGINSDLNLNIGPNGNAPQGTIQGVYQAVDNLSWIHGKHELKFGVDARDQIAASTFIQRLRGDYEYSTLDLFLRDQFPDQLAQRNVGARPYSGNLTAYYAYVNDNWKVTRNLTLNLGVRYEVNGVAQSMRLFDANAIANTPGVLTFQAPISQKTNFAPRVGFAYSPGNSASTSIRGGFGIAYDQVFDNVGTNATPPQASATVNSVATDYPNGNFLSSGAITPGSVPSSLTAAQARAASSSFLPALQKQGYAITWNLSYQRVFAKNYTAEIRYIGNKGVHLLFQNQINRRALITPSVNIPLFYSQPTQATLNSQNYGLCPAGAPAAAPACITVGNNQASLNNPLLQYGYSSTITEYAPLGNSQYNGLAMQLTRRFADHLLFQGAYTWSHLIDDSTAEVNSTTLTPRRPQDFNNLSAEKASSALDHRQRLTFTSIYELPTFGHNLLARTVIGGFRVGAIYTYETGELATPQSAADANLNGDAAGDRTVINLNGAPGTSSDITALTNSNGATVGYRVNDPNAFYVRARAGVFATSGRNILRTPAINNIDFNLSKTFSIRERTRFEIRGDFFNGLNHPQYTVGTLNNTNSTNHAGETNYLTPGNALFARWDQVLSSHPRTMQLGLKISF